MFKRIAAMLMAIGMLAFAGCGQSEPDAGSTQPTRQTTPTVPEDYSGNPIITSIFTADPSAHVWEDGRLYVYASHDIFPSRGCDLMDKYHVFSTDNMVDWRDEGEILSAADLTWGRPEGGFMWAPDCAYKDGTYYFYYPHPSETDWNATWRVGVATSDKPAADFTDRGMMKNADGVTAVGEGVNSYNGKEYYSFIDPCVFEDDDGTFYMTVGGGGQCYIARMAEDMMSLAEELIPIYGLTAFHEGSWLFKEGGLYYLVYADGGSKTGDHMRYAISESPYGPYNYCGLVLNTVENCSTTHGSVVKYKDNWYVFYHNARISGNDTLRSVCVDRLEFDEDGLIREVEQTLTGVEAVGPIDRDRTNIELKYTPGGIAGTEVYTRSTDYGLERCTVRVAKFNGAHTCVENMHYEGASVTFTGIDGGEGGKALLTVRYSCGESNDATAKVDTDVASGYFLRLPKTGGWDKYTGEAQVVVDLKPGKDNTIVIGGGMSGFNLTGITVSLNGGA